MEQNTAFSIPDIIFSWICSPMLAVGSSVLPIMTPSAPHFQNHIRGIKPEAEENIEIAVILICVEMGDLIAVASQGNTLLFERIIVCITGCSLRRLSLTRVCNHVNSCCLGRFSDHAVIAASRQLILTR